MTSQQRSRWLSVGVIWVLLTVCQYGEAAKIIGTARDPNGEIVAYIERDTSDQGGTATTAADETSSANDNDQAIPVLNHDQEVILNHIQNYNHSLSAGTARYMSYSIVKSCIKYEVDALLLAAMLTQESGFNPNARSGAGAMGVGQLMPGTAASLGVTDPWDIAQNIDGAACYFGYQLRRFQNAGEWQLTYAVAAYNAGPGAIIEYNGVPPYRETIDYVYRIAAIYNQLLADAG